MTTDAAFFEEVSAFLNTGELPPSGLNGHDTRDTECVPPLSAPFNDYFGAQDLAVSTAETLRKQRYLLRLKNERETLKRTEHELTSRLTQLQQETEIKKRRTVNNQVIRRSSWRDFALLQRGQLHHPKEEHKKLVSAVNIQSRYFKTLSELVPEPLLRSAIIKQITSMSVLSSLHTNNLTNRFEFAEQLRQVVAAHD
ncbi:hypothetical protein PC129_g16468 [Phytophthora cactorum]|uniref:Uncharacterized protein n=1 Tax=Phytophthora cactorum TaxID=29920 RepID=A0A8T1HKS9_9STRA|nr:hypothetical protein PC118_g18190 [Phytophthora cactorum]KAG3212568.1 hypothetical protein PC129_g16468 [Phytophthora cactorum]